MDTTSSSSQPSSSSPSPSKDSASKRRRRRRENAALWITYLNIVLYSLSYQLQRPVEPFLVDRLSQDSHDTDAVARKYGQLQSFFSAIQTLGSPLVGILLDRIGIRKASSIVFLASAVSYAILACATDMRLLFLSKVPTALQHAFLVAQAVAATSTAGDDGARAQALGRMTTAYMVGATLGPALGGYMAGSRGDLYLSAKVAVVISLLSVVLSLMFLPDNVLNSPQGDGGTTNASGKQQQKFSRSFMDELKHSAAIACRASLLPLLTAKVIGGVSASMYSTVLPMVLTQDLGFSPSTLGLQMSSGMFGVATFGALGMAPLTKWRGAAGMARLGIFLRSGLVLLMAAIITHRGLFWNHSSGSSGTSWSQLLFGQEEHGRRNHWLQLQVIMTSVLYDLSSHSLATGLTTQTTGAVDTTEQGALLGLEHGLFSLARVGGPPLGTYLLTLADHFVGVAVACGGIDLSLWALLVMTTTSSIKIQQQRPGQERKSQ